MKEFEEVVEIVERVWDRDEKKISEVLGLGDRIDVV